MEPSFWRERWQEGRIGFHEGKPNAFLAKYVAELGAPGRVFVPLCGKAEDMAFLASRGHEVVGVDLVESALRDFFREHGVAAPEESKDDRLVTLRHEHITLLAGDLFAVTKDDVGEVTAAYDRASIVALPEDMRVRYVAHLRALLPKGARILTVAFDYDESRFNGPPFAVKEAELRRLYAGAAEVRLLDSAPLTQTTGALAQSEAGATESVWLIKL